MGTPIFFNLSDLNQRMQDLKAWHRPGRRFKHIIPLLLSAGVFELRSVFELRGDRGDASSYHIILKWKIEDALKFVNANCGMHWQSWASGARVFNNWGLYHTPGSDYDYYFRKGEHLRPLQRAFKNILLWTLGLIDADMEELLFTLQDANKKKKSESFKDMMDAAFVLTSLTG
jgi:hypothetical protein